MCPTNLADFEPHKNIKHLKLYVALVMDNAVLRLTIKAVIVLTPDFL